MLQEMETQLRVESLLRQAAEADAPGRFLCLVPTERRVRWLKRQFFRWAAQTHGKASPEPLLFTLAGFLWTVLARIFPPGRYIVLSDAHQMALFDEAARRAPLSFFRRGEEPVSPGLLEQLAALIRGIRRDGVDAAALRARLQRALEEPDPSVEPLRLRDILALAEAYEALLGDDFLDEPQGWAVVRRAFQEGAARLQLLFPGTELLLLEGFSEFRPPELGVLEALVEQELPVVVRIDYSPENGPLFGNFQELIERLREAGYCAVSTDPPVLMTEQTPPEERIFLPLGAYLRRWLFNTERDIRHPGFSAVVRILECRDREEEVLVIARLVKDLLCCQGYRPSEIAIVMRQPELYSALFREVFALYRIPANVTDRFWLVQSPIAVAVVSLLSFPLNGFRRVELERLVHNPYVRLTGPHGEPLDGVNLLAVAVRRRILGGHRFGGAQGWQRQLQMGCQFLQRQLELLQADPYSDPLEREQLQRELEACHRALQDFLALRQRLSWEQRRYTPKEFLRLVTEDILLGMGLYDAVCDAYRQLRQKPWQSDAEWLAVVEQVERDARALTAVMELTEEFVAIIQRRWGQQPRPLEQYLERFLAALRAERYQVREKPGAGVTVTSIEQTRGIPFRVLILCGAVDGEFPLPYRVEHLLGYELPHAEERHRRAERMLFYQFLTNHPDALEAGEQRLYITYPLQQGAEQLVRSPFVDELLKVTSLAQDGCVVSLPELEQRMHAGSALPSSERFVAVRGSLSELLLEGGSDGTNGAVPDAVVPDFLLRPWEPDPLHSPLPLGEEEKARFQEHIGVYFSATELELYRQCPYRYFATHVLRLRPWGAPPLELSPLERGVVLHRIVYRFLRELQQQSEPLALPRREGLPALRPALLEEEPEVLFERLRRIAEEELQHVHFEHPWFQLEWEQLLGAEGRPGELWFWLQQERERQRERPGFVPVAVELGFGMQPTLAAPVPLTETAWLRGRIDRIELFPAEGRMLLGVADYKSGPLERQASQADLHRGYHLQLPLYLWAAQHVLAREYGLHVEPAFAAFYALRPQRRNRARGEASEKLLLSWWHTPEPLEDILERARAFAEAAVEGIRQGFFPVAPYRNTVCRSCPYKALCRIEQLRVVEE
ncbi:ATP-dependent helicase/deoxyribonuclease subunit B [bacterium HR21]|nr:ATP-dependent helicase/deoxyribonuclease subunit B [bacterium HR21]